MGHLSLEAISVKLFIHRLKLTQEFSKQLKGVFTQWETDLSKAKEQEEKLQVLFIMMIFSQLICTFHNAWHGQ